MISQNKFKPEYIATEWIYHQTDTYHHQIHVEEFFAIPILLNLYNEI